jgi:D-alanine-D-alanine ligase
MDKVITKQLLEKADLPTVPYQLHMMHDPEPDFGKLVMNLGCPLFVKPASQGSSVGVSKVNNEDELRAALELAHKYDTKVLIERGIAARELETAVLGNKDVQVSVVGEIKPDRDFYDYDSKYDPHSTSEVTIPADIDESVSDTIRDYAERAYKTLGCEGLSRIDFFLAEDGAIYINEINTLPGFTNISMYPKLWRHNGLNYPQLIERLIALALEK